jgi:hypothetical protein
MMLGILMVLAAASSTGASDDVLPSIPEIIVEEGQFAFTDGSSTYQFYADGSFLLEPAGISGRAVEGHWEWLDSGQMEITGTWSWYNGVSAIDDTRRMTLNVSLRSTDTVESDALWGASDARLYDVYFTVEELVPIGAED